MLMFPQKVGIVTYLLNLAHRIKIVYISKTITKLNPDLNYNQIDKARIIIFVVMQIATYREDTNMDVAAILRNFAFSKYESKCYLALLAKHPANGSQLSRLSGIARSRIYDVLRSLANKKIVFEIEKGLYVRLHQIR